MEKSPKKNLYIYAHYTFGIGHLQRASLLAEALSSTSRFNVCLFYSGARFDKKFEKINRVVRLPAEIKKRYDSDITIPKDAGRNLRQINRERIKRCISEFKKRPPEVFITEFFPFAYFRLNKTMIPILEYIKDNYPKCTIICSARDFPVSDRESISRYDLQALNSTLDKYYDLVLIHSPKKYSMFGKKNPIAESLKGKNIRFTGYIVENTTTRNKVRKRAKRRVLITVGGGRDGGETIEKALKGLKSIKNIEVDLVKGPFSDKDVHKDECFAKIKEYSYMSDLSSKTRRYDLIISMCGYNTAAEIMLSGSNAIVFPRHGSYEQNERAKILRKTNSNIFVARKNTKIKAIRNIAGKLIKTRPRPCNGISVFGGIDNSISEIENAVKDSRIRLFREIFVRSMTDTIEAAGSRLSGSLNKIDFGEGKVFVAGWGKSADIFIEDILKAVPEEKLASCIYTSLLKTEIGDRSARLNSTHPLLSARNIENSRKIVGILKESGKDDTVIIVSSGGGSAMFEILKKRMKIESARRAMKILLKRDVDCRIINFMRRSCSEIKDGRLLSFIKAKKVIVFLISDDVLTEKTEECASYIASGPTKRQRISAYEREVMIKELRRLKITDIIPETTFYDDIRSKPEPKDRTVEHIVLADNKTLLKALGKNIRSEGIHVVEREKPYFGESREVSKALIEEFSRISKRIKDKDFVYICGGESTVEVKGDGRGGRVQQLVAEMIRPLHKLPGSYVFGFASDGQDFIKGIAGAYADSRTYLKSRDILQHHIRNNDTYTLHKKLGTLVRNMNPKINLGDAILICRIS